MAAPGCADAGRRAAHARTPFGFRRACASNSWLTAPCRPCRPHLIEPFLAEAVIVDELTLQQAPRIVAAPDSRVLITRGDRAYARGRRRR